MGRRGNGEGSVHRLKNGRWQAQITIGFNPLTGKQQRRYTTADTRREAVKALDALRERHARLSLTSTPQTLEAFSQAWLRTKSTQVRPRTLESYEGILRRHVLPKLGRARLEDLRTYHVQQLLDQLAEEVGARTSNYARTVLKILLNQAVNWEMIVRNPMAGTMPKSHEAREPILWTPDEVRRFLAAAENHRLYALFYVVLLSGLRLGEALGLTWGEVHDDGIAVVRSVETRSGSVIQNPPKSRRGTRLVSIDPATRAVLRAHEERQRAELCALGMTADQRPERVFTSEVGRTLNASNLGKIWRRLQDDAGVRRARFHDLRHMHLSRLVMRGMDIKTVADRAGHADPILTMRQYIHAFDAQRKKAAIPLEQLLDEETSG